ncbi:HNH endonuclease [Pelosinus sp. sgz500959]|uniref:HNH endonuclease n=1 Tax=Pelosinus sp. sgz500959 TaxID=3242472 RepID=UPI00366D2F7E
MARARNIKPGFFTNDELAECEPLARLLFAGLWTISDREGRLEDRPKRIKAEILPFDNCNVDELLSSLHEQGFITRYFIESIDYIQITNFVRHQNPHPKEAASTIPAMPGHIDSGCIPYYVPPTQRQRIFSRDNFKCQKCDSTERLSIDHIIPRSKGGTNEDSNLQTLCIYCNSGKGNSLQVTSNLITRQESDKQVTKNADSLLPITESISLSITESSAHVHEDLKTVDNFLNTSSVDDLYPSGNSGEETPARIVPVNQGIVVESSEITGNLEFMAFWRAYPKKSGMELAFQVWSVLTAQGVKSADLALAASKYSMRMKADGKAVQFMKSPYNFMNEQVYVNYLPYIATDCPKCKGRGWYVDLVPTSWGGEKEGTIQCDCRAQMVVARG